MQNWPRALCPPESPAPDPELLATVARLREQYPTSRLAVGGSWSSPKLSLPEGGAALEPVALLLTECLSPGPWEVLWWANVLRAGDALTRHDHRWAAQDVPNDFAAVYYLQGTGELWFWDQMGTVEKFAVAPGKLLVFTATLEHAVPTWDGDGERISLAFNVRRLGVSSASAG